LKTNLGPEDLGDLLEPDLDGGVAAG